MRLPLRLRLRLLWLRIQVALRRKDYWKVTFHDDPAFDCCGMAKTAGEAMMLTGQLAQRIMAKRGLALPSGPGVLRFSSCRVSFRMMLHDGAICFFLDPGPEER